MDRDVTVGTRTLGYLYNCSGLSPVVGLEGGKEGSGSSSASALNSSPLHLPIPGPVPIPGLRTHIILF